MNIYTISLILLWLHLSRKVFRSWYRDFKSEWNVGYLIFGVLMSLFISPLAGWGFWVAELSAKSAKHGSPYSTKVGALIAGESKEERRERKAQKQSAKLKARDKRIAELEEVLELDRRG